MGRQPFPHVKRAACGAARVCLLLRVGLEPDLHDAAEEGEACEGCGGADCFDVQVGGGGLEHGGLLGGG